MIQKKTLLDSFRLWLVSVYKGTCNVILRGLQKILYKRITSPARILIFRTGSLGDNICAMPAIEATRKRFPQATIDILTNAGKANLVTLDKLLSPACYNAMIDYLGMDKRSLFRSLHKKGYDLVVYLPQADASFFTLLRDLLAFRFISRAGFGWEKLTVMFARQTQEKYIAFQNETSRLNGIMKRNGIEVPTNSFPLNLTSKDETIVNEIFEKNGLQEKRKNIGIVVGAKRPQNRWPIDKFKQVIEHFHKQYNLVLVGGPEDRELTKELQQFENIYDLTGQLSPIQSALALQKCALALSNDTGPMHLAYAVGTPVVAIFSSRDFPGKWYPPTSPSNRVFRAENIPCSICLTETCHNNLLCIRSIEPQPVIKVMEELLQH